MTSTRRARRRPAVGLALVLVAALTGCAPQGPSPSDSAAAARVPRFDHIVIVVEENKARSQVEGMPFLSGLARGGATFSDFRAETHPSQPNYLALWSGSLQGVDSDRCPVDLGDQPSLGSQLLAAGRSVSIYSEGLPRPGYTGCASGRYVRKHNPLADFRATSGAKHNLPFRAFPTNFADLPSVSMVVPNLDHDMHDGSVSAGDTWLAAHLSAYRDWAPAHNSLLIVTFDEDDGTSPNRILTTIYGANVRPGVYGETVDHYRLLHTVEAASRLGLIGAAGAPITDVWK
ncbi:alkaline phosphatase family protein [Amnibacterium sp.]|uniref:alkaline phosphatase family protein n=1 Tax=Amnibacterium sp. TaxID=1872496 RepID=UPI002621A2B0|nr:alkaline phosphatase family protein [Amnibacterium sp.]MCU1473271.1 phosphoesterase [Amnibacterium sp.]